MKKILAIISLIIIINDVSAQSIPTPKIFRGRKHRGFYLSMGLGANQSSVKVDSKNFGYTKYSGLGGSFDLKIGGTISENLILHATLLSHGITGPKIDSDDYQINSYKTDNKINLSEGMIGIGLTYYTVDNFLLSTSMGVGGFTLTNEHEDIDITTDKGFSIQLKAGKEWWVSPKWGIGCALYYHHTYCNNQTGNIAEENLKSNNIGIVFNATLNGRK
ncbi:MAG: hypothetical protein N4A71_14745 [Carboxylicivirga sp.]|jgi:hypothetical protein|nr:hypothetical protein [Carboxylicivirga sp.]